MPLDGLVDEQAIAELLGAEYGKFARPVAQSLEVFLEGLPPRRLEEVLAAQARLPLAATPAVRMGVLAQSCPVLHKLGQVLARDRRLSAELRDELRLLESMPPSLETREVAALLEQELGPLARCGVELPEPPIAEASVAIVVPFRALDARTPREGVFKLLKPGIEERLAGELELLARVGEHLDASCLELGIPSLEYQEVFQQVRTRLMNEIRLDEEQRNLAEAARELADLPAVVVPEVLPLCTPRITAMQRIRGVKVTDHDLSHHWDCRQLASLAVRALVAQPIFSRSSHALFHSDPHAGNLLHTDDGRLAILDWSLAGRLGEAERMAMMQVMLAAVSLDGPKIRAVLASLDQRGRLQPRRLAEVVDERLRRLRRGELPGLSWLVAMLDEAVQLAGLRPSPDLLLFRKSLHALEGVVADLGAGTFECDDALFVEFLRRFGREWLQRFVLPPQSRALRTRLSNLDLARMLFGAPAAVVRFWQAELSDWLGGARPAPNGGDSTHCS
jgi:ubiquinone biosynthesis protein